MARARRGSRKVDEADLSDALRHAAEGRERVVVVREGRAVAAVVSLDDLELLEALEDRLDLEDARAALEAWEKAGRPSASLDDILADLGLTRADIGG